MKIFSKLFVVLFLEIFFLITIPVSAYALTVSNINYYYPIGYLSFDYSGSLWDLSNPPGGWDHVDVHSPNNAHIYFQINNPSNNSCSATHCTFVLDSATDAFDPVINGSEGNYSIDVVDNGSGVDRWQVATTVPYSQINITSPIASFSASNVFFNPITGHYSFDYTGPDLSTRATASALEIWNNSETTKYWQNLIGSCTSSSCVGTLASNSSSDSAVTQVRFRSISDYHYVSQTLTYPLALPTSNTPQTVRYDTQLYTLSLSSGTSTTTNATASFGSVTLPVKSNVCVQSEWVLENDTNSLGVSAILVLDSTTQPIFGDTVPLSASGIAFTIARDHCFTDVAAGSHSFAVKIDQYPFRTGDTVRIREGSTMWITAYPTF